MIGGAAGKRRALSIGLAGCGKMGSAMALGWLRSGAVSTLTVLDPNGVPSSVKAHPAVLTTTSTRDFLLRAADWDILVLALKPQAMKDFCAEIASGLADDLCVVSIAAGLKTSFFETLLGNGRPVIRAMPNTPALVGEGITVAVAGTHATDDHRAMAACLFTPLGQLDWIADERLMDAVTALSGSGPAYVFYLIETIAAAGEKAGLEKSFAMRLARQTVIGSAALLDGSPDTDAATLRENVTSPNGTTAAALTILMDGRLQSLMTEAVEKAARRGRELSE